VALCRRVHAEGDARSQAGLSSQSFSEGWLAGAAKFAGAVNGLNDFLEVERKPVPGQASPRKSGDEIGDDKSVGATL
jgi:hypothetical protein